MRWPPSKIRREVIMITDGIDRLRNFGGGGGFGPRGSINSFSNQSGDVDATSSVAQKSGVIVYSIYAQGVGSAGRSFWSANVGQSGISQISQETGGESFSLFTQNAVSFQPYLNTIQRMLNNQYFLIFQVTPIKKAGFAAGEDLHRNSERGNCQREECARAWRRCEVSKPSRTS